METPDTDRKATDISTAARMMNVSVETLRKRLQRGRVEGFKAEDGTWRVVVDMSGTVSGAEADSDAVLDAVHEIDRRIAEMETRIADMGDQIDAIRSMLGQVMGVSSPQLSGEHVDSGDRADDSRDAQLRSVLMGVLQFLQRHRTQ